MSKGVKSCKKVVQKLSKNGQKMVKKLSKSCQKVVKFIKIQNIVILFKIGCKNGKILKQVGGGGGGGGGEEGDL
jgi:hypothetical protein